VDVRNACTLASVALVRDQHDRSALCQDEVGAGDTDVGRFDPLAEILSSESVSFSAESSGSSGSNTISKSSVISSRDRWSDGPTICEGPLSATWTTNSPRSVSQTSNSCSVRASLRSISSVVIDFDLTTLSAPFSRASSVTYSRASAASSAT
jgi:hypothetical protein